MNSGDPQPDLLIAAYLEAAQRGETPDQQQFLDDHPACALELAKFFLKFNSGQATHVPEAPRLHSTVVGASDPIAGTLIGRRYKLIETIGEGGMGTVWVAEQKEPVRRRVAIKLIKSGMDSRAVLGRFEAERQALAVMDHPHIARVLDGGTTSEGRPFFVMELVKGIPLTDYCDQCQLTIRERLALFSQVCSAVQHAHQKGIIHRDLKPSNILVTEHDGRPTCKVIDFGLAKAIQGAHTLTDASLHTAFGTVVGTPLYMAPEQLGISALDIDTRADIYSLGVVLYELLTGTTPIERQRVQQAALEEILRIVREEEPLIPSQRLSTSDQLPSVAARRHIEPARLTKLIRGDVDWIVMKALEKDRNRRYETAAGLAMDIAHYLAGEAVLAAPPSRSYRIRKFVRRHRGPVLAAGLLLVSLSAGIGGTSWGYFRAQSAATEAAVQTRRAVANEEEAIAAVRRFGNAVSNNPDLKNNPELEALRKSLLQEPLAFFRTLRQRLQSESRTSPAALSRLADAAFELGNLNAEIGDKEVALQAFVQALDLRNQLVGNNPGVTDYQIALADCHTNLGSMYFETGKPAEALKAYQQAAALCEQLTADNPGDAEALNGAARSHQLIGKLFSLTGRPDEALEEYERALVIFERVVHENPNVTEFRHNLATTSNNLAILLRATGKSAEALQTLRRTLAIQEELTRENPALTEFQDGAAASCSNIGQILEEIGKPAEAIQALEQSLSIRERLVRQHPTVTAFQDGLATVHLNIGLLLSRTDRLPEALVAYRKAVTIWEQLASNYPSVVEYQSSAALAYDDIGVLLSDSGRNDEALDAYQHALGIDERLARENPQVTDFQRRLASSLNNIGLLLSDTGDATGAREALERALSIRERLASDSPSIPDFASQTAGTLHNLATLDLRFGNAADSVPRLRKAIELQKRALATNPHDPVYRQFLQNHYAAISFAGGVLNDPALERDARGGLQELRISAAASRELELKLQATIHGMPPNEISELLESGQYAYDTYRYSTASRLYGLAASRDPALSADRETQLAYNAACCAALAASGQSIGEAVLAETDRERLRAEALTCLREELDRWEAFLAADPAERHAVVAQILQHWQNDGDLAAIRDAGALSQLPDEERLAFDELWKRVADLLNRASPASE